MAYLRVLRVQNRFFMEHVSDYNYILAIGNMLFSSKMKFTI